LTPDVIVAGGGVIGLCTAAALAERQLNVCIISEASAGEASSAAAGMLAPSVERTGIAVDAFGIAARDRYPSYLEYLLDRTGVRVALNRRGILQIALTPAGVKGLRRSAPPTSAWLDASELSRLELSLSHALGAVHNPLDGAVDNVTLIGALRSLVTRSDRVAQLAGRVSRVTAFDSGVTVTTHDGDSLSAGTVVIAAGAWSGTIEGTRLARAVTPSKGQLVAYVGASIGHAVYGPTGYLVPRRGSTIAGTTMERTGFDSSTSAEGVARIRAAAQEICPGVLGRDERPPWAGLRPVTPDGLPLLGRDPEFPSVIYACGHGRNGILMAPLTGDVVADLVTGSPLRRDLSQFRPDRF